MISFLVLLVLFMLPALLSFLHRHRIDKLGRHWISFAHTVQGETHMTALPFASVPKTLRIWVDHGNQDSAEFDLYTNTEHGYESILTKPITITPDVPNKSFIDVTNHLKPRVLSPDNVIISSGGVKGFPTVLQIEVIQCS